MWQKVQKKVLTVSPLYKSFSKKDLIEFPAISLGKKGKENILANFSLSRHINSLEFKEQIVGTCWFDQYRININKLLWAVEEHQFPS